MTSLRTSRRSSPLDVQVVVIPDAMLIQAKGSLRAKTIFRTVEFPRRIVVTKARLGL